MNAPTQPEQADGELTLRFALAARRRELQGMHELAHTSELVSQVGQLIHELQKERGRAALLVGQTTEEQRMQWLGQTTLTMQAQRSLGERLTSELNGERLLQRRTRWLHAAAHALHAMDGLAALRASLVAGTIQAEDATLGYGSVIGCWLGVVIEALDGPSDPHITRVLVALLNFMQAKELCGQERAVGVAGFARGSFNAERRTQMASLARGQARSFELFLQHASAGLRVGWEALSAGDLALQRLRDLASTPDAAISPQLAQPWFDVCTARIDALHGLEQALTTELAECCRDRVAENERVLSQLTDDSDRQAAEDQSAKAMTTVMRQSLVYTLVGRPMDALVTGDAIGDTMARSVLDLLLEQGARLHEADLRLSEARRARHERRRIEQAKWWLVTHYRLSEPAAQERLQRTAMNNGLTLLEVADRILASESPAG